MDTLRRGVTPERAIAGLLAGAALATGGLTAGVASAAPARHATHPKAHRGHARRKARRAPRHRRVMAHRPAAAVTTRSCKAGTPGGPTAAYDAFLAHVQSAHLEESPQAQVTAITRDLDGYAKLHTVWVENMTKPSFDDFATLPAALFALYKVFADHFDAAHLETSPGDQLKALLLDPDGYTKTHTVLIENMLAPLQDWAQTYVDGSPGACTTDASASPAPAAAAPVAAAIRAMKFDPADLTVAPGTTVTWTNDDDVPHTVSSMHGGPLASKNLAKGDTYSYTFDTPGTYMYVCNIHPDMKGTVTVR